jgi:hypothetical protein
MSVWQSAVAFGGQKLRKAETNRALLEAVTIYNRRVQGQEDFFLSCMVLHKRLRMHYRISMGL